MLHMRYILRINQAFAIVATGMDAENITGRQQLLPADRQASIPSSCKEGIVIYDFRPKARKQFYHVSRNTTQSKQTDSFSFHFNASVRPSVQLTVPGALFNQLVSCRNEARYVQH